MKARARRSPLRAGGDPLARGIDQPAAATRTTLICWLLVLTVVISAECAWVLWLRDAWTVTAAAAGPLRAPGGD